jgi:hypothetical protein
MRDEGRGKGEREIFLALQAIQLAERGIDRSAPRSRATKMILGLTLKCFPPISTARSKVSPTWEFGSWKATLGRLLGSGVVIPRDRSLEISSTMKDCTRIDIECNCH